MVDRLNETRSTLIIQSIGILFLIWIGMALACGPTSGTWKGVKEERQKRLEKTKGFTSEYTYRGLELRFRPNFEYPDVVPKDGSSKVAIVMIHIDSNGDKYSTEICESSGYPELDSAVLQTVNNMEFVSKSKSVDSTSCYLLRFVDYGQTEDLNKLPPGNICWFEITVRGTFFRNETPAEMIKETPASYPQQLKMNGIEGTVWVKSLITKDGKVKQVLIHKTSGHEEFDQAAMDAAWTCEYLPAVQNCKLVSIWVTYKVEFVLD